MTSPAVALPPHRHPELANMFRQAEGKYFTDAEFAKLESLYPNLKAHIEAAKDVRAKETGIVGRSVKEIYTMYPYEQHHEHATAKCVRDARYVLSYATLSMLIEDPRWFEDKLLIWMKTILQALSSRKPVRQKPCGKPFPGLTRHWRQNSSLSRARSSPSITCIMSSSASVSRSCSPQVSG